MKGIKNFLSFVEINTKTASVLPFLAGTGYTLYRYGSVRVLPTLIFFAAMLLFDMTTTAINNHVGHRQTGRIPHYPGAVSVGIILVMGVAAAAMGIYLVSLTDIVILLTGILCFGLGIIYSWGFLPIARTPFGELFSSSMGILIPFIAVEISHPLIAIDYQYLDRITIVFNFVDLVLYAVAVMPLACCIANIMLANNICDVEEDTKVKRFTLPFYIGIKKALVLYRLLYVTAFVFIAVGVVFRIVPLFTAVVLLAAIPVWKNIRRFVSLQDKRQTFITCIINFLFITVPYVICLWLGGLIP